MAKPKPKKRRVPRMRGRPTLLTPAITRAICDQLGDGRSLRDICGAPAMPSRRTVTHWVAHDPIFCASIARAREAGADFLAEEIVAIADTPVVGVKTVTKPDGGVEVTEGDMIEHRQLQVRARMWFLGKVAPKKYGDRTAHEVSGPGGEAIQVQPVAPPLTPPEVTAALGKLVATIEKDAGVPPGKGGLQKRLQAAMDASTYLHPDLYAARKKRGSANA